MRIIRTIPELLAWRKDCFQQNLSVGFVPTMGALHDGHIHLVARALHENECVVVSIFVNPTQFNNPVDLEKYPRTEEQDIHLLEKNGCSVVFIPTVETMYPSDSEVKMTFGYLENIMEGAFRPGHFQGVGLIVAKLFNRVLPTRAYFGQKDVQQVAVIHRLIHDLSFPIELVVCQTVREDSGLAMSSRNQRLSAEGKQKAAQIYAYISRLAVDFSAGFSWEQCIEIAQVACLSDVPELTVEYIELVEYPSLLPVKGEYLAANSYAICFAGYLEEVRLIDNIVF